MIIILKLNGSIKYRVRLNIYQNEKLKYNYYSNLNLNKVLELPLNT